MKSLKSFITILAALFLVLMSSFAVADNIIPASYDMTNGTATGSISLRDDTYTGGTGNAAIDYSILSGGKGDLTDGITSTGVWWNGPPLSDPYVGWSQSYLASPLITFHFSNITTFSEVAISMCRQYRPGSVDITIGANSVQNFATFDKLGVDHEWVTFPISNLMGDTILVRLNDNTVIDPSNPRDWIMIDEIKFQGTVHLNSVPEPTTMLLLCLGLVGLAGVRKKLQ